MGDKERKNISTERQPVTPQWSILPKEHEHAPTGQPPFEILYLPERPRVIGLENVYFNQEGRERLTDAPELEQKIEQTIEGRKRQVEEYNTSLGQELSLKGLPTEEIEPRLSKFFDGKLARLHPDDLVQAGDFILPKLGKTTYFTYAGSRERQTYEAFGYDRLGLALAVCTIATAPSKDESTKILYTVRGTLNEAYPGWFHTVGGTVKTVEDGIANPNGAIVREVKEELGIFDNEFRVEGVMGIIMNNFDLHPEIVYHTEITTSIEDWLGKRETDREVEAKYFTDTPENLEALILGQKNRRASRCTPTCSSRPMQLSILWPTEIWRKMVPRRV